MTRPESQLSPPHDPRSSLPTKGATSSTSWLSLVSGLLGQPAVRLLTVLQALVGDPGHQGGVGTSSPGCGQEQQPQQCGEQRHNPSIHPGPSVGEWELCQRGLALVPLSSQGPGLGAVLEGGRAPASASGKGRPVDWNLLATLLGSLLLPLLRLGGWARPQGVSPAHTPWRFCLASANLLTTLLGRPGVSGRKLRLTQGHSPAHESWKG